MKKIFISAGHSNTPGRDRGAVGNGMIEGDYTAHFRKLVVKALAERGVTAVIDGEDTVTSQTVSNITRAKLPADSILVDFHLNASSNPAATGCEVVIPDAYTAKERAIASDISSVIASVLCIRNRGVKTESQSARGKLSFMRPGGSNLIVELGFISNAGDMEALKRNEVTLAAGIARVLHTHAI